MVRRDLFSDEDEALLDASCFATLATEKLEKHAAKVRRGCGLGRSPSDSIYSTGGPTDGSMLERQPTAEERREFDALKARQGNWTRER